MPTTQFISTTDSTGTSNLMHLLNDRDQQVMRLILPRDIEKVFGPGNDVDIPSKGYTDPEWYFRASDGCVWGIGWRWGQARLRGRGATSRGGLFYDVPPPESAAEFVAFITKEISCNSTSDAV